MKKGGNALSGRLAVPILALTTLGCTDFVKLGPATTVYLAPDGYALQCDKVREFDENYGKEVLPMAGQEKCKEGAKEIIVESSAYAHITEDLVAALNLLYGKVMTFKIKRGFQTVITEDQNIIFWGGRGNFRNSDQNANTIALTESRFEHFTTFVMDQDIDGIVQKMCFELISVTHEIGHPLLNIVDAVLDNEAFKKYKMNDGHDPEDTSNLMAPVFNCHFPPQNDDQSLNWSENSAAMVADGFTTDESLNLTGMNRDEIAEYLETAEERCGELCNKLRAEPVPQ